IPSQPVEPDSFSHGSLLADSPPPGILPCELPRAYRAFFLLIHSSAVVNRLSFHASLVNIASGDMNAEVSETPAQARPLRRRRRWRKGLHEVEPFLHILGRQILDLGDYLFLQTGHDVNPSIQRVHQPACRRQPRVRTADTCPAWPPRAS